MNIPFYDLKFQHQNLNKAFINFFKETLYRKDFVLGNAVLKFEKEFANFNDSKYSVGVSNGTDALFLALKAFKVTKGDEVIVPSHTFIASALPIIKCGAKPVFVDCEKDSFLASFDQILKRINDKTKAIILVHIYGETVDIPYLKKIINKVTHKKIPIIEDCSQSHGSRINNLKSGNLGDIGCFSLYPSKNLGALGDAGILTTNNNYIYKKILSLRNWGSKKKYVHENIGYNHRLDTIQAGFLSIKLKQLHKWNNLRVKLAAIYYNELKDLKKIKIPNYSAGHMHVYHLFVVKVKERNKFQKFLLKNGIQTIIHYPTPCHKHKAFENYSFYKQRLKNAEAISNEVISLPLYPGLSSKKVIFICKIIKKFFVKNQTH
tara:strand:- start:1443 stop:2570 length:1128 start_codon:yes stop_codon:yes gene_type:complete